jgi:hypothetical protein
MGSKWRRARQLATRHCKSGIDVRHSEAWNREVADTLGGLPLSLGPERSWCCDDLRVSARA